jgi:2-(1,2-epoxy-1,2-dihydrophenyl)acetyl-CoA isomerase
LAGAPTSAIAFTKRLLNDSTDTDRPGAFVAEAMAQELQSYAHDSTEGVKAFMEKRPTEFTGW